MTITYYFKNQIDAETACADFYRPAEAANCNRLKEDGYNIAAAGEPAIGDVRWSVFRWDTIPCYMTATAQHVTDSEAAYIGECMPWELQAADLTEITEGVVIALITGYLAGFLVRIVEQAIEAST